MHWYQRYHCFVGCFSSESCSWSAARCVSVHVVHWKAPYWPYLPIAMSFSVNFIVDWVHSHVFSCDVFANGSVVVGFHHWRLCCVVYLWSEIFAWILVCIITFQDTLNNYAWIAGHDIFAADYDFKRSWMLLLLFGVYCFIFNIFKSRGSVNSCLRIMCIWHGRSYHIFMYDCYD